MEEERDKKPLAIGRSDERRIKLIYISTFTGLPEFIQYTSNDLFITISVYKTCISYFNTYSYILLVY